MELPVRYGIIRDEYQFDQAGTPQLFKLVPIFLGIHGPFTERIAATDEWGQELARRVAKLKASLESLPT